MEHFFPRIQVKTKKGLHQKWNQARSQKFAMGGLIFGSGGKASSNRRSMEALENFAFFLQNSLNLELF